MSKQYYAADNTYGSGTDISKHYYAADNTYGSETDMGFANTWFAIRFSTREQRDEWVQNNRKISAISIKKRQIEDYGGLRYDITPAGEAIPIVDRPLND